MRKVAKYLSYFNLLWSAVVPSPPALCFHMSGHLTKVRTENMLRPPDPLHGMRDIYSTSIALGDHSQTSKPLRHGFLRGACLVIPCHDDHEHSAAKPKSAAL